MKLGDLRIRKVEYQINSFLYVFLVNFCSFYSFLFIFFVAHAPILSHYLEMFDLTKFMFQ